MIQHIPENVASQPDPGGTFAVRWSPVPDEEIQTWQLVRCDYPITAANISGLFGGGLDLMTARWELHPSVLSVIEDTGVSGKHYVVLGVGSNGQAYAAPGLKLDAIAPNLQPGPDGDGLDGIQLSGLPAQRGWVKGKGKRDRYSGVF